MKGSSSVGGFGVLGAATSQPRRSRLSRWSGQEAFSKSGGASAGLEAFEQPREKRADATKFGSVCRGERGEKLLRLRGQRNRHDPPVLVIGNAADKAKRLQAIDQFAYTVSFEKQVIRELADRHPPISGSTYRQQRLMLLRLQSNASGGFLAKAEEAAQFVPETSERRVILIPNTGSHYAASHKETHLAIAALQQSKVGPYAADILTWEYRV